MVDDHTILSGLGDEQVAVTVFHYVSRCPVFFGYQT